MAATKGRIIREYPVTVTHDETHVIVTFDGNTYRAWQDGWTSEAGAVREAATFLLDTLGCWVDVTSDPYTAGQGAGQYTMRLRIKHWD